jgi:hypothetical protein
MAIERNDELLYSDDVAKAQRITVVDGTGAPTQAAPVTHVETITRYNAAGTRIVGASARSYSVAVVAAASVASPTLGGVALPAGYVTNYEAPQADKVTGLSLVTVTGDDVIVTVIP